MVGVAQLVEHQVVVLRVEGSSPSIHPIFKEKSMYNLNFQLILGVLLVAFGIQVLIKVFFGLEIPLFQPLLGCLLIYWGLTLLLNKPNIKTSKNVYWQSHRYHQEKEDND